MAVATHSSTATGAAAHGASQAHTRVRHAPVTPGKVAMWLFLATEVMFFTGLIGSYIVLRAGSTHTAYSNLYSPATPLKGLENTQGVVLKSAGENDRRSRASPSYRGGLDRGASRERDPPGPSRPGERAHGGEGRRP